MEGQYPPDGAVGVGFSAMLAQTRRNMRNTLVGRSRVDNP